MTDPLARLPREGATSREIAIEVARILDSMRGEDIVILDVGDFLQITSFFVVVSGSSARALKAMAEEAERLLKRTSLPKLGSQSDKEGRWVCLDYSDVVVHLFDRQARAFYDLDHLWGEAQKVAFPRIDPEGS